MFKLEIWQAGHLVRTGHVPAFEPIIDPDRGPIVVVGAPSPKRDFITLAMDMTVFGEEGSMQPINSPLYRAEFYNGGRIVEKVAPSVLSQVPSLMTFGGYRTLSLQAPGWRLDCVLGPLTGGFHDWP